MESINEMEKEGALMEERKTDMNEEEKKNKGLESAEWATEALEEMDDFIESQGIYIRQ